MRAAAAAIVLLALAACSTDTSGRCASAWCPDGGGALGYGPPVDAGQPEYTFPGCANEDGLCPRSATAHCAVELAAQAQTFCIEDDDCELTWLNPRCLAICEPVAVSFDDLDVAHARMQAQIDRYCSAGPCAEPSCLDAGGPWIATCYESFCTAVTLPPDAGMADGGG